MGPRGIGWEVDGNKKEFDENLMGIVWELDRKSSPHAFNTSSNWNVPLVLLERF
jgi:hypothetical protein